MRSEIEDADGQYAEFGTHIEWSNVNINGDDNISSQVRDSM